MSIPESYKGPSFVGSGIDITDDGLGTGRNVLHTCKGDQLIYNKPVLCEAEQVWFVWIRSDVRKAHNTVCLALTVDSLRIWNNSVQRMDTS